MAGWKPALRLARRDALRNRGRSILVLVMIALPVLAVSAADVVYKTSEVSGVESLDRRLGAADARIYVAGGAKQVIQAFDPDDGYHTVGFDPEADPVTLANVRSALGRDVTATETRTGQVRVDTERGIANVEATELDPASPLVQGLFRLTSGRWPTSDDEVVVNADLAAKGFATGAQLTVHEGSTLTVVGTAESTVSRGYPVAVAPVGALGVATAKGDATWLVGGGSVSWDEVRDLNLIGAVVLSRAVVEDPPPASALPAEVQEFQRSVGDSWVVVVLVVVMALLEVVLLAGPAFAVGARRQSRTLALMAASGGTPTQARRVILAGGVVLGSTAAVLGVGLGIVVGWALLPLVQHFSDGWLGPFEVSPVHLLFVAAFGLLSAFLAAVVPAWIASRQDVVAVLAGRRGDRKPSLRSPLLGLLLVGAGIAGSVFGATSPGDATVAIAGSAVVAVLGMILLVPVVVATLARLGRRLPLVARYAVRDAARHRTRTVPAIAAVAATVAGVVALGIANSSDAAESEGTYMPQLTTGMGALTVFDEGVNWDRYADLVRSEAPSVGISEVLAYGAVSGDYYIDLRLRRPGAKGREVFLETSVETFGSLMVGPDMLDALLPVEEEDLGEARRTIERGGIVVLTDRPVTGDRVSLSGRILLDEGKPERLEPVELPAYFLQLRGYPPGIAVAAADALEPMGLTPLTGGLLLDAHDLTKADEENLAEALRGLNEYSFLYVERGYQEDNETMILLGILFGLGAVLMLGGTLTATFLALSDARPDLATLSAVGAAPRTRRGVAASYALIVGFVGALLGAAVGFIPGIAITYPLTSTEFMSNALDARGNELPSHFVDIPWSMILGLVVVLPLVTAAIVGLTARSRLPLVARLD